MPLPRSLFPGGIPGGFGPLGGQRDFPRQLSQEIEGILHLANQLRQKVEVLEEDGGASPVGYFPRVKAGGGTLPTTADPYQIAWDQAGKTFDDVGAAAATAWQLPGSETYEGNLDEEMPWFAFRNTSAQRMKVIASGTDTIAVDNATASAAGGHVELITTNTFLLLALVDDQWRSCEALGYMEIDQ